RRRSAQIERALLQVKLRQQEPTRPGYLELAGVCFPSQGNRTRPAHHEIGAGGREGAVELARTGKPNVDRFLRLKPLQVADTRFRELDARERRKRDLDLERLFQLETMSFLQADFQRAFLFFDSDVRKNVIVGRRTHLERIPLCDRRAKGGADLQ